MDQRNYQRPLVYVAMAVIGFATGAVVFSKSASRSSATASSSPTGSQSPHAGSEVDTVLSAIAPGDAPRDEFARAHRSKRSGIGRSLRDHLKLVADTPLAELPDLLLRYERTMPGSNINSSTGDLVRGAICDRLLAEAPDAMLDLALDGRSDYIEFNIDQAIARLLEQQSYEELEGKIAACEVPVRKLNLTNALLIQMIKEDPKRGWQLALQNPSCNLGELAKRYSSADLVESVILADQPIRLPPSAIEGAFAALTRTDPDRALQSYAELEGIAERQWALGGLATHLDSDHPQVQAFTDALPNDQQRLRFYRARANRAAEMGLTVEPSFDWQSNRSISRISSILKIEDDRLQRILLEETLSTWKARQPGKAREWAEQNGYQEMHARLHDHGFPVTPVSPTAYDIRAMDFDSPDPPDALYLPTIEDFEDAD